MIYATTNSSPFEFESHFLISNNRFRPQTTVRNQPGVVTISRYAYMFSSVILTPWQMFVLCCNPGRKLNALTISLDIFASVSTTNTTNSR